MTVLQHRVTRGRHSWGKSTWLLWLRLLGLSWAFSGQQLLASPPQKDQCESAIEDGQKLLCRVEDSVTSGPEVRAKVNPPPKYSQRLCEKRGICLGFMLFLQNVAE